MDTQCALTPPICLRSDSNATLYKSWLPVVDRAYRVIDLKMCPLHHLVRLGADWPILRMKANLLHSHLAFGRVAVGVAMLMLERHRPPNLIPTKCTRLAAIRELIFGKAEDVDIPGEDLPREVGVAPAVKER